MINRDTQNTHAPTEQHKAARCVSRNCAIGCTSQSLFFRQAGFTIVEVMVAVVVFAVGLAAIAGMQTRSIVQSSFSDQMSTRISALKHRSEALKRMPVIEDSITITDANTIDVEITPLFKEENMCEYGKDCSWAYIDYDDDKPHKVRQRITRDYPMPGLIMVDVETAPTNVGTKEADRRTVRTSFIRSTRWN